ncbi:MAG: hypothetical protein AAFR28_12895, partial [Pseudomonadota bacterium]
QERGAAVGDGVDRGGLDAGVAVAGQGLPAEVVERDEEDVGGAVGGQRPKGLRGAASTREQCGRAGPRDVRTAPSPPPPPAPCRRRRNLSSGLCDRGSGS